MILVNFWIPFEYDLHFKTIILNFVLRDVTFGVAVKKTFHTINTNNILVRMKAVFLFVMSRQPLFKYRRNIHSPPCYSLLSLEYSIEYFSCTVQSFEVLCLRENLYPYCNLTQKKLLEIPTFIYSKKNCGPYLTWE